MILLFFHTGYVVAFVLMLFRRRPCSGVMPDIVAFTSRVILRTDGCLLGARCRVRLSRVRWIAIGLRYRGSRTRARGGFIGAHGAHLGRFFIPQESTLTMHVGGSANKNGVRPSKEVSVADKRGERNVRVQKFEFSKAN